MEQLFEKCRLDRFNYNNVNFRKKYFKKIHFKYYINFVCIGICLLTLFIPFRAFAAPQTVEDHLLSGSTTSQTKTTATQSYMTTGWTSAINTILALAILVAIIYFGLKLLNRKVSSHRSNSAVQILVQQALTTNRSVHVVEIAGQFYVLGVGETITCIDKITDEKMKAALLNKLEQSQNQAVMNHGLGNSTLHIKEKLAIFLKLTKPRMSKKSIIENQSDPGKFQETLERQLESLRSMRDEIEHEQQKSERHDQT